LVWVVLLIMVSILGTLVKQIHNSKILQCLKVDEIIFQIKKVLMVDCNKISETFDTEELMEYLRLVGTLGEVTSYNDIFPILTLIALLSGEGLTSEGARFATDMRNKYFTVLVTNQLSFDNFLYVLDY